MLRRNYESKSCNNCQNSMCGHTTYRNPSNSPICNTHVDNLTGVKFKDAVSRVSIKEMSPETEHTLMLMKPWM